MTDTDPYDRTAEQIAAMVLECTADTIVFPEPFVDVHTRGALRIEDRSTPPGVLAAEVIRPDGTVARTYRITIEAL